MYVCSECGRRYPAPGFCTQDGGTLLDARGDELLGATVGSYRVSRKIGEGGMGTVYRAVHPAIGSQVAIKVLSKECSASPSLVERFFAEARAVNLIRHERIVSVSDMAALADGRPYIVMELLEGEPLSSLVARHGPLPLGSATRIFLELLDALAAAHDKGIVHRDLKPDNVFLTRSGHVKVVDFGIAKLRPDLGGVSDATRAGSLMGTPFYMAPEQAAGANVDPRADLYSAGVALFEVVTGQRPFMANTLYELLKAHVEQMPPRPISLRADIPAPIEDVLLTALQKDPNYRFQSARDFSQALRGAMQALLPESFVPVEALVQPGADAPARAATSPSQLQSGPSHPFPALTPMSDLSTLANTTGARAPEEKRGGRFGYAALITCGVVVLATLGSCVACFGMTLFHEEKTIEIALGNGEVAVIKPGKFDPAGFAPRAASAAQRQDGAAKFVGFKATGHFSNKEMDLTRSSTARVVYSYRTPTGCIQVDVSATGLSSRKTSECATQEVTLPRCSLERAREALQKAGSSGAWSDTTVEFAAGTDGQPEWSIVDDGQTFRAPDSC
ncbi:MAG: serine/threonine-protein kinase [Polyangiaceae bacterium]